MTLGSNDIETSWLKVCESWTGGAEDGGQGRAVETVDHVSQLCSNTGARPETSWPDHNHYIVTGLHDHNHDDDDDNDDNDDDEWC